MFQCKLYPALRNAKKEADDLMNGHVRAYREAQKKAERELNRRSAPPRPPRHPLGSGNADGQLREWERMQAKLRAAREREEKREQARRAAADARAARRTERDNDNARRNRLSRRDVASTRESRVSFDLGRMNLGAAALRQYQGELQRLSNAYLNAGMSARKYNEATRQLIARARQQAAETSTLRDRLHGLRAEYLLIGAAAGAALMNIVETGKQFQQVDLSFNTAFGKDAQKNIAFVRGEAKRLGVNFLDVSKQYAKMAYGASIMGMKQEDVQLGFTAINEAAMSWGLSNEQVQGTFKAFTDMISKGTVQLEELKGQLGDRMPDAMAMFAKALDPKSYATNPQKAIETMMDTIQKGNLKALDTLPKVFKAFHETYGPQATKAMYNITAQQNRFINTLNDVKNIIFRGGLANLVGNFFGTMEKSLIFLKPVAAALGGIADGMSNILYAMELGTAYVLDFAVKMGWLNHETDKWSKGALQSFQAVGSIIGAVLGVKLIAIVTRAIAKLFGLRKVLRLLNGDMADAANGGAGAGRGGRALRMAGKIPVIGAVAGTAYETLSGLQEEGFFGAQKELSDNKLYYKDSWLGSLISKFSTPSTSPMNLSTSAIPTYNPYGINSGPSGVQKGSVDINVFMKGEGINDFWDVQMENQADDLYSFQLNK